MKIHKKIMTSLTLFVAYDIWVPNILFTFA